MTSGRPPRRSDFAPRTFGQGPNPFADPDHQEVPPADQENLFAASASSAVRTAQPDDYERVLPDRSRQVLWFGVIGAGLSALTLLIAAAVVASAGWWARGWFYCLPTGFVALVFTIPACVMGAGDLRAIRAGAMTTKGLRATRLGWWFGCVGSIAAMLPTAGGITVIVLALLG